MKLAVVIDAGHGPAALKQATRTQRKLLDCCEARLDSIRLAAPRLLRLACRAAVAEDPGMLVIIGGPRAARTAAQIAYERGTPILFLPGFRTPKWARHLWGRLSLDDMISALARGDMKPTRLSASTAGGQIFFDSACCGLLPLAGELRQALAEADSFSEVWKALVRGMRLSRLVIGPGIRFHCEDTLTRSATALVVSAGERGREEHKQPFFACKAWKHSALDYLGALAGSGFGADWQRSGHVKRFACTSLATPFKPSSSPRETFPVLHLVMPRGGRFPGELSNLVSRSKL